MHQTSQIQTFHPCCDLTSGSTAKHLHSHIPLPAADDLLAARELELGTAEGFFSVISIAFLAAHRKEDLTNVHTSTGTLGLAESTPHSSLESISPST
jgi:hypothetical protein